MAPPITVPLRAPELKPGTWVQGPPVSMAFVRGAVVLVDFWESTCVNCLRTLPYLKEWHRRYASRGLVMVGIHTPEFELTATPGVVAEAVAAEGIPYPVLLDPERANWQLFANHKPLFPEHQQSLNESRLEENMDQAQCICIGECCRPAKSELHQQLEKIA